ncbi:MAG: FISUMP domain-containing protein [Rikenellaceae bacterium]
MKIRLFTLVVFMVCVNFVFAQNSAEIKTIKLEIEGKKNGEAYFIEIADRNVGASSNKINSFGEYYAWNNSNAPRERITMGTNRDEVGYAVEKFKAENGGDWRLPTRKELNAIMNNIDRKDGNIVIYNQKGDATKFIYLPYSGTIDENGELSGAGRIGMYWTSDGMKKSKFAIALEVTKTAINNPQILKSTVMSVRCVRNVK